MSRNGRIDPHNTKDTACEHASDLQYVLLNIPDKLIAAPGQFSKNAIYSCFAFIPIIFCDVIAMHRADFYVHIRKSNLV